jgi:hypothetical protein
MAISKEQREFEIYDEFFTAREDDQRVKEVLTPKFRSKVNDDYLKHIKSHWSH